MLNHKYLLKTIGYLFVLSLVTPALADDEDEKESRNCIQTRSLKGTAVVDDHVLFIKKGNSVYHSPLPRTCKGLSRYKQFSYKTTSGSLCSQDLIYVMDSAGRESRACSLGPFYEIDGDELKLLVENSRKAASADASDEDESTEDAQDPQP